MDFIGTGKTSTLVALLQTLSKCNLRVHAAAPTNVAVCELARRCLAAFSAQLSAAGTGPGRRLADFLLIGSRKRLQVQTLKEGEDALQSILLDDRLNRLQKATGQVRESSALLLSGIRTRSFQNSEEANDGNTPGAMALAALEAHVKFTTAAGTLAAALKVLTAEAPAGTLPVLPPKSASRLLDHLAVVQNLSESDFRAWKGLGEFVSANEDAPEERQRKHVHDTFVTVHAKLKNLVVVQDMISQAAVMQAASLVFSTVNVGGRSIFRRTHFDVAVVDEATQLLQAETAIVLRHHLRCLVLVGDDKQLPATVMSDLCAKFGFGESLFSRLLQLKYPHVLLNTQYRMHPAISRWPRLQFYGGEVVDGPNVLSEAYRKDWHATVPPLSIYDLTAGQEDVLEHGSKFNAAEIILVRHIMTKIRTLKARITVGVLSPYSAQIAMLDHLSTTAPPAGALATEQASTTVRVSTIDSFQGQECDIIIFSTVRSNDKNNIGFLRDERRLNVAVTRAKFALIVICSTRTLSGSPVWNSLFLHAQRENCLFDASSNALIKMAADKFQKTENRMASLRHQGDLFGNAPWKVQFCSDFKSALAKLSSKMSNQVIKTCLGLAHGEWPKFELITGQVPQEFQEVLHVHRVFHIRLLWSVDVARSTHEPYLRIWNVVLEDEVGHAVRRVVTVLLTYSPAYLQRCAEKHQIQKASNRSTNYTHVPKQWVPDKDFVWLRTRESVAATGTTSELEHSSVGTSAVLMKFFTMTSDVARMFITSNNFANIELPFEMSATEDVIVRFKGSVFILGRSGTGKTTVILHRMFMLSRYNQLLENGGAGTVCKQLLVTASPILCEAIRRSYDSMCKTSEQLQNGTSEKAAAPDLTSTEGGILNDSTEMSLPRTFQHCLPQDFPLIVTYLSFLRMLDASLDKPFFTGSADNNPSKEVDFMRFSTHYFPHFSAEVSKLGDAALIYTEIMSHIKGSTAALHTDGGCLSAEAYSALAKGRSSTLDHAQRAVVYEAFLKYEKLKAQMHPEDFDVLDVVYHVYRTLSADPRAFRGELMTTVSVDEVQDLVPAQIVLFKFVCTDPAGFVFAGDTAQTIAHGVGFRFETVKDIFYHEYVSGYATSEEERATLVPDVRHLSENFRTHKGVVMIANSVVELVLHFFPHSIDKLDPEYSMVAGPAPIFIDGEQDLVMSLFQNGTMHSCEFGAEQVILVRDEETKRQVLEISGNRALVLTVLESKGMEFTDCLIYNFFGSSPLKNDWRVLYNRVDPKEPHPAFDEHKHSALCVELKFLYVLLTRARQHVIIFDSDVKSREPMMRYWLQEGLVEKKALDQDIRNVFLAASNPEEWKERGKQFYERKQYANARLCFQRAGDHLNERLCNAAELAQEGDKAVVTAPVKACELYRRAARLYLELPGYICAAARCFEQAGDFTEAAQYFALESKHKDAGRCFEKAEMWVEAAKCYAQVDDVSNALRCCYTPRDYDLAQELLNFFLEKAVIPESDYATKLQECARKAAIYFHSLGKRGIGKMMEFVAMFRTTEEKRSFLQRYKHFDLLLQIEIADNCFAPAARIYEETFDYANAQCFYEKASQPADVIRCALKIVRHEHLDERYTIPALSFASRDLLMQAHSAAAAALPESNVHARMAELLLLQPATADEAQDRAKMTAAGPMTQTRAATVATLKKFADRIDIIGVDTAWMVQFSTLQYYLRALIPPTAAAAAAAVIRPSRVNTKRKLPAAAAATVAVPVLTLSVEECELACSACRNVDKLLQHIEPALTSMSMQQHTQLSSTQQKILLQCIESFEFRIVSTGATTSFASTYISSSTEVECLRSVKGLVRVFRCPPAFEHSAPGAPRNTSRTFKMGIREFCQHALKFFKGELSYWLQQCAAANERAGTDMHIKTFADRAANIIKAPSERVTIIPATHTRFQLLRCLHDVLSMETAVHAGTNETQAASKARQMKLNSVQASLISILLPAEPLLENIQEVSRLRTQDSTRVVQLVNALHDAQFRQTGLQYDLFARALLTAELHGATSATTARLRNILAFEFRDNSSGSRMPMRHKEVLSALVEGFAWENITEDTQVPKPDWKLGPFFYGIQSIASCVHLDIQRRGGGMHVIMFHDAIPAKTGCFSPTTFTKLVQKSFVLLLLHWKSFSDVVLPTTLAVDVLVRRNSAYKRAIQQYASVESPMSKEVVRDISIEAWKQLHKLMSSLLYVLERMTPEGFQRWFAHSVDGGTAKPNEDACKNAQDSFCASILQLILLLLVNTKADDFRSGKYCARVLRLVQPSSTATAVRALPYYLGKFLSQLNVKYLNYAFGEFSRTTGDPVLLLHCKHSCAAKIPQRFVNLRPTRMILEVGAESVQIVPQVTPTDAAFKEEEAGEEEVEAAGANSKTAEATVLDESVEHATAAAPHVPTQEERLEKYYVILRRLAAEACARLKALSPLEALQRFVEREFVRAAALSVASVASAPATSASTTVTSDESTSASECEGKSAGEGEYEGVSATSGVGEVQQQVPPRRLLSRWCPEVARYKTDLCPLYLNIQAAQEGIEKAIANMQATVSQQTHIYCS